VSAANDCCVHRAGVVVAVVEFAFCFGEVVISVFICLFICFAFHWFCLIVFTSQVFNVNETVSKLSLFAAEY